MGRIHIQRRKISLLKDEKIEKWVGEKVIELVEFDIPYLCEFLRAVIWSM